MSNVSILITGGGTGGHISPGIAIYEELNERGLGALFLAGKNDIRFSSMKDISKEDLYLYNAPTLTMNIFKLPLFFIRFFMSVLKARSIIRKNTVGAVVGMGGYVSAPALIAARTLKVPIFLCEQNAVPGKVTRKFEKHAQKIYGTFSGARDYLQEKDRYLQTGNPIRKRVLKSVSRDEARKTFHMTESKKVILVIGGSQGALKINEMVLGLKKAFPHELKDVGFIWSTGSYSYDKFKEQVQNEMEGGAMYLSPFIENVGHAYAASDLAISRSGSGVMMELAAMGIPSVLIPFPFAAMNHQEKNADEFHESGAAVKISNDDAVPEKAGPLIFELLRNDRSLQKMKENALKTAKPDAASEIVNDILKILNKATLV